MTQRTCNIIMICKGNYKYYANSTQDAIKQYIAHECDYPIKRYTDKDMDEIMVHAFMDFMSGCDRVYSVLFDYFRDNSHKDELRIDAIIRALTLVQVRDNHSCINGFTEEMMEQSARELDF